MWHTEKNPLRKVSKTSEDVAIVRSGRQRKLHKAFLRYHDPANWPILREALRVMGRSDLIGPGKRHLIPLTQPGGTLAPGERAAMQKSALVTRREATYPGRRMTPGMPGNSPASKPRRPTSVPRHPLSQRKGG
jgi:hypothetical protein